VAAAVAFNANLADPGRDHAASEGAPARVRRARAPCAMMYTSPLIVARFPTETSAKRTLGRLRTDIQGGKCRE
jgi:hypothetical protein